MITIYNHTFGCCLSSHKIKPEQNECPIKIHAEKYGQRNALRLNEKDLLCNNLRMYRDMTIIINNSFKEKSEKIKIDKQSIIP